LARFLARFWPGFWPGLLDRCLVLFPRKNQWKL